MKPLTVMIPLSLGGYWLCYPNLLLSAGVTTASGDNR